MDLFIPKAIEYAPINFHPDLLLHHYLKCLRTTQRKYTTYPTCNNFQWLTRVQQSFHSASIAAESRYEHDLIYNFSTNKDPNLLENSLSHSSFPLNFTIMILQLMLTMIKLIFLISAFIPFSHQVTTVFLIQLNYPRLSIIWNSFISHAEQEVMNALCNLNPGGLTTLHMSYWRTVLIHHLFTTSTCSSNLPSEWKTHKMIPVFKSETKLLLPTIILFHSSVLSLKF